MNEDEIILPSREELDELEAQQPDLARQMAEQFGGIRQGGAGANTVPEPEVPSVYQDTVNENIDESGPPSGAITELGEKILDIKDTYYDIPAAAADKLNEMVPDGNPLKGVTQFADDRILSADERRAKIEENIQTMRDEENPLRYAYETAYGAEKGLEAGVMLPLTVAAAISQQSSDPWSDPPEILRGSPLGSIAFEIGQLLPLSIATAGIGGGAGLGIRGTAGVLATESAVETATQDSLDEIIYGPELAGKLSELTGLLLGEEAGIQVAEELASGDSFNSQAFIKTIGFLQNLGFNLTPGAIKQIYKASKTAAPEVVAAAKAMGKSVDEVDASVNNVVRKEYSPDLELNEGVTPDTAIPTADSASGTNSEAFVAELLRQPDGVTESVEILKLPARGGRGRKYTVAPDVMPLVEESLTSPQRKFFNKITAWSNIPEAMEGLTEAAKALKALALPKHQRLKIKTRAAEWMFDNMHIMETDPYKFLRNWKKDMTVEISKESGMRDATFDAADPRKIDESLLNRRMVNEAGMVAGIIIAEEQGVAINKIAKAISNNRQANIPHDELIDALNGHIAFAQMIMMPVRQGKRYTSNFMGIQTGFNVEDTKEMLSSLEAAMKAGDLKAGNLRDATLGDLIASGGYGKLLEGVQKNQPGAKQLYDQLIDQLAYGDPKTLLTDLKIYGDTLDEAFKTQWTRGLNMMFYGFMLSRTTTQAAAFASSAIRMALQPLNTIASSLYDVALPQREIAQAVQKTAYGQGELMGLLKGMQDFIPVFQKAWNNNSPINAGDRFRVNGNDIDIPTRYAQDRMIYEAKKKKLNKENASFGAHLAVEVGNMISKLGTNPLVNYGPRALMAQDEAFKVIRANQVAYGAGFAQAAADKAKKGSYAHARAITENLQKVFTNGAKYGKINPESDLGEYALESARYMSFQRAIPDKSQNNNAFNSFWRGAYNWADESPVFKYFSPFVRMGWDSTEQVISNAAGVSEIARLQSLRKQIVDEANSPGATAAQKARFYEMESNMAFGYLVAFQAVLLASQGYLYGKTTAPTPEHRNKLIFPIPGDDNDYAFDYSKIQPISTWMSVFADLVGTFKYGGMSRADYFSGMTEAVSSFAINVLDANFFSGLNSFAEFFNYRNWNTGSAASLSAAAVSGLIPAAARGIGGIIDPEEKIYQDHHIPANILRKINQRFSGGAGLQASKINPFTGQQLYKTYVPE